MLMTKERRPAIRTLRGCAIDVLQEGGAIHECEEHGWTKDRADPMPANAPSISLAKTRRLAFRRTKPWRRSGTCWIRSAIPARSVRRSAESSCPYPIVAQGLSRLCGT